MKYFNLIILFSIVFAALQCTTQSPTVSTPDASMFGRNDALGKFVDIRGFSMYYEIYGQGEPLLMIHGNSGSIESFSNQIPYFSSKYKVIAVDSRAHGKSVDESDTLSFKMMADDFNALLDKLKVDSCNVLGWSDGGITGLLLAIRHPAKVKKLAITGANLWPDSSAISGADYLWGMKEYENLRNQPSSVEQKNKFKLFRLDYFQPQITRSQLSTIQCPTLVIGGDHDIILPAHTMLIAQSIPGALLWILPNSGHATLIDYKDQFNKTVDDFFRDKMKK